MLNFEFQNPTKIIFGKGQIAKCATEIPKDAKILMTYGGGSIKKNGVYDQVMSALKDHTVLEFGGIEPNPRYETLMSAVKICKEENIDFLLSVGGGSALDGTKFIAAAAKYDGADPWDLVKSGGSLVESALPIGCVLTLPATGSEMNGGAVITRESTKDKIAFVSIHDYPTFSILDPETTYTLPLKQVANGIIDTFIHVTEQYITYPVNNGIADRFAEGILLTLIENAKTLMDNPTDYESHANFMWAATWGLNGFIAQGVPSDWATHLLGHEITVRCGLDHGVTLAIIWPSVMKIMKEDKREKLLQYAKRVWNITEGDDDSIIDQAIAKTCEFFESLGVKTHLSDYGFGKETIPDMLEKLKDHNYTAIGERGNITLDVSEKIYELSM